MSDGCAPGKSCCDDCKTGAPPATERFLVQAGRGFNAGTSIHVLEQGDDLVIWGPASTEAISEDAKLVRMDGVQQALARFFDVGTATFLHKDQNLARLEPMLQLDPSRVPAGTARNLALHLQARYGGAPTAVLDVTPELVQAFPRELTPHLGKKAFFAGVRVKGDTATKRFVQDEIRQGRLDSYSISGMPTETEERIVCEGDSCKTVLEVKQLDLSAVTLGSRRDGAGPLSAKVRNPGAAFLMLQQAKPETSIIAGRGGHVVDEKPATVPANVAPVEQATPVDATTGNATTPVTPPTNTGAAPTIVEQAKPAEPQTPAAAAKVVEQGEVQATPANPPVDTATAKDITSDLLRRLEAIEQRLATVPATPPAPSSPAPGDKPADATPEAASPPPVEEAKKYMEQAEKRIEQAAIKAAEAHFAKLLQQAKPADTPTPASPADPSKTREAAVLEAARSGDAVQLLQALGGLRAAPTPVVKGREG